MGIDVASLDKNSKKHVIKACSVDRQIEIVLEAISPNVSRFGTVAKQGPILTDRRTAQEINILSADGGSYVEKGGDSFCFYLGSEANAQRRALGQGIVDAVGATVGGGQVMHGKAKGHFK